MELTVKVGFSMTDDVADAVDVVEDSSTSSTSFA